MSYFQAIWLRKKDPFFKIKWACPAKKNFVILDINHINCLRREKVKKIEVTHRRCKFIVLYRELFSPRLQIKSRDIIPYFNILTFLWYKRQWQKQQIICMTNALFWSSMGSYGNLSRPHYIKTKTEISDEV